jgi:hypothetical protein
MGTKLVDYYSNAVFDRISERKQDDGEILSINATNDISVQLNVIDIRLPLTHLL